MHLGIDLGGTKMEIIALDDQANTLLRRRIPSPRGDYAKTLNALCDMINQTEYTLGQQGTIGIGIPGSVSTKTNLIKNANSTWLIGQPLKQDLINRLNREIEIANDADCFALSEARDGAAAGFNNVFGVILGTGVGGGIVIHGQLVSGPNAITGEWGHNPLPWLNETELATRCYCGKLGCIETFLSGPGLSQQFALSHSDSDSQQTLTTEQIIDQYRQGHPTATASFERYLDQLARALASVINILDPDVVVFGGGLSNIDELYQRLPPKILTYVFSDTLNTRFVKAQHGDSSGVRGAAWLGAGRT